MDRRILYVDMDGDGYVLPLPLIGLTALPASGKLIFSEFLH